MPSRGWRAAAALAASLLIAAGDTPALTGMWGAGDGLLALDGQGGRLQTGCTLVRLEPVRPDTQGRFRTTGHAETLNLTPPVGDDEADAEIDVPAAQAAMLEGRLVPGAVELSLSIGGGPARSLRLNLGERGSPARCL